MALQLFADPVATGARIKGLRAPAAQRSTLAPASEERAGALAAPAVTPGRPPAASYVTSIASALEKARSIPQPDPPRPPAPIAGPPPVSLERSLQLVRTIIARDVVEPPRKQLPAIAAAVAKVVAPAGPRAIDPPRPLTAIAYKPQSAAIAVRTDSISEGVMHQAQTSYQNPPIQPATFSPPGFAGDKRPAIQADTGPRPVARVIAATDRHSPEEIAAKQGDNYLLLVAGIALAIAIALSRR